MPGTTLDEVSAPADYDQLFRQYYSFVVGLVRKLGIDEQGKEDVASEILCRFYERRFLEQFNPDLEFEYAGSKRPARFKSFLSAFVASYVRHHRDRQQLIKIREPLQCDQPVGDGSSSWIEVFGPCLDDVDEAQHSVEEQELVGRITAYLISLPNQGRRSKQDVMDLPRLFDLIVVQVRTEGKINAKDLQAEFGVSNTAIHSWLKQLRGHIAVVIQEQAVV